MKNREVERLSRMLERKTNEIENLKSAIQTKSAEFVNIFNRYLDMVEVNINGKEE